MIIFIPLSGLCFYVGYRATCGPQRGIGNETLKYRVGQAVCSILWFIFSILRAGCFNGWMRIKPLMDEGSGGSKFCIFLVILEAIMLTIASALGIFCIFMAGKVYRNIYIYIYIIYRQQKNPLGIQRDLPNLLLKEGHKFKYDYWVPGCGH